MTTGDHDRHPGNRATRPPADSAGDTALAPRDVLDPRHWPLWLLLGLLRLAVHLPWRTQIRIGAGTGRLIHFLLPDRRRIAATNIRLCLPDIAADERERMVRRQFENLGTAIFETAITWWRDPAWFEPLCEMEGREHLDRALAQGNGVLLLTPHYTALDIGCIGIARQIRLCGTFAPPRNPIIHKLLLRGRRRHSDVVLDSGDLRGMIRALRANRVVFFAPDQAVRRSRGTVVVPYFGIATATSSATSRLARLTGAPVLLMLPLRKADGSGYRIRLRPPLEDFPTRDAASDTARVNAWLADHIRANAPEQYFWIHQRFKRGRSKHERIPFATPLERPPVAYRLANLALALPLAIHARIRAARDGGPDYRSQRLGRELSRLPRGAIWIHAASVGEVATAIPLLERLAAERPEPVVLSTNTPTGRTVAAQRAPAETTICYLPIDRPHPVRRFVRQLRPRIALIMETELWPWLYAHLDHAAIPIIIVNGRLSPKTRNAPRWLRPAHAFCLERCRLILARSEDDAIAFRALGGPRNRTRAIGNLKYAAIATPETAIDPGRPFVLAASTHDDEEAQLARAWRAGSPREHLLVIAPRHPERGDAIERALLAEGFAVARRSRGEAVTADTGVYLADTMGELTALMAGAEVVIMGGSFIPHGGQNLLEPARMGRATVIGPHMDNFREEAESLEAAAGVIRAPDAAAAVAVCSRLLADPGQRRQLGERGRAAVTTGTDIVERYLEAIREVFADAAPERRSAS